MPTFTRADWRRWMGRSMLSRHSPDPPDRRTSEEAHLCGHRSVRAARDHRASCDGERGGCPEWRYAATGIVVLCDPECRRESADRLRPATAGIGTDTDLPDDTCDQVHLHPARREGGQVLLRLPELR